MRGFRQGLKDIGFVEGENVAIEYRLAEGQFDRLPSLAAELVRRQVAVIAATKHCFGPCSQGSNHDYSHRLRRAGGPGRAWSCRQPRPAGRQCDRYQFFLPGGGGKAAGAPARAGARRYSCGRACQPSRHFDDRNHVDGDVAGAGRARGLQIQVFNASTSREINAAFAAFVRERPDALYVGGDAFFQVRRAQLVNLASRHAVPATYGGREFVLAGGLMSYGSNLSDAYRQVGVYAGRILKGGSPADLPVVQATKFELVINAETARMLGLDVPPTLLARADEVIE